MTDELRAVTAKLGPKQTEWLESIKAVAGVSTDEEAVRSAIFVAHLVLDRDELTKIIEDALQARSALPAKKAAI